MTCGYFVVGISGFISLNKWVGLCWTDLQLDVWLLFKYIYTYTVVTTTSAACAITYHSGNCYGYQYRCFQIDLPFDFDSV